MSRSSFMPLAAISTRARPRQETAMPRRASRQWIGLGVGLALAVGTAAVPVAYAASPSPLPAIAQALNSATSYQIDLTQTDHNATQPNGRVVIVVVRRGKLVGVHLTERYTKPPAGQSTYTELVANGSKTCGRDGARGLQVPHRPKRGVARGWPGEPGGFARRRRRRLHSGRRDIDRRAELRRICFPRDARRARLRDALRRAYRSAVQDRRDDDGLVERLLI